MVMKNCMSVSHMTKKINKSKKQFFEKILISWKWIMTQNENACSFIIGHWPNEGYKENREGYMKGIWDIEKQSQWRVHRKLKGVHEGYRRDRNPVSMKGTWRIEGGTWRVQERSKTSLNEGYMEKRRGYMRGTGEIEPQSQWRVQQVAQGQYVVRDTRCPALHDC